MRTPADHVHEIRIVLLTGDEYVVGRFASKGGIRMQHARVEPDLLAVRAHRRVPTLDEQRFHSIQRVGIDVFRKFWELRQ